MTPDRIAIAADDLSRLLEERLGVRGRTLERRLTRAGRLLPRAIRREAAYIVQAQGLAGNPRLMRMVDEGRLQRAHALVAGHLRGIDPGQRRRAIALRLAAAIGFNLLAVALLVVVVLVWRGYA